jgi:putative FmdB family regulatory protein
MPLYEYYCESCDGVFEAIRQMREASVAVPCPECSRDGRRMMSTFSAFTFRDGYPRRLPDRGTFWHKGKEVKQRAKRMKGWEHPELAKPKPKPRATAGEVRSMQDSALEDRTDTRYRAKWGVNKMGFKTRKARKPKREKRTLGPGT